MIPILCFITDANAQKPIIEQALSAAKGGAKWIQLREKTLSSSSFKELAVELKHQLDPLGAKLIINDRWQLVDAVNPFGLHIGQNDGDPTAIRKAIGPNYVLGLSVENRSQLNDIPKDCVDYLGVGPVKETSSKPDHAPPIGFKELEKIALAAELPCMAIGGLTAGDMAKVKQANCKGVALVSAIARAEDCEAAANYILASWNA